ncbi:hypothetical protein [Puniceibacterium sp. IMCC21224]|uniref:hypothetical protein n=1 Tax=Puniceibacterium sp. IMCC21224 TaxID=1618204 RepID=UPI00065DA4A6|nr:hypothetical protein [Puniceibacterium sp. IMCC21224]KMK65610.1 hypothetical protein IMCC21224_11442 [Puniceibacterium sp. IMCC21224]
MQHTFLTADDGHPVTIDLREPEAQLITMLRFWTNGISGQSRVWNSLSHDLGAERASACLLAFDEVLRLIRQHGWGRLTPGAPQAPLSEQERNFARFVLMCVEADREEALQHALFLVTPAAMLPLFLAAGRLGLPLICRESRCRLQRAMRDG